MDIEAANTAHQRDPRDQISYVKKSWKCPCNGCKKAAKQERERILEELSKIDLNAPYQLNAVGLMQLVNDIINIEEKKK
jgi:hypothetical protein